MSQRIAAIDIGTNSTKMTVGEVSDGSVTPVLETSETTRLGKGVDSSGKLSPEAMKRTVDAVVQFHEKARSLGAGRILARVVEKNGLGRHKRGRRQDAVGARGGACRRRSQRRMPKATSSHDSHTA